LRHQLALALQLALGVALRRVGAGQLRRRAGFVGQQVVRVQRQQGLAGAHVLAGLHRARQHPAAHLQGQRRFVARPQRARKLALARGRGLDRHRFHPRRRGFGSGRSGALAGRQKNEGRQAEQRGP